MEKPMDKKEEAMLKIKQMTIEEKIAHLPEKEAAYIKGFIEGALIWSYEAAKQNGNGKIKKPCQKRKK
jgi:hypothetical protein